MAVYPQGSVSRRNQAAVRNTNNRFNILYVICEPPAPQHTGNLLTRGAVWKRSTTHAKP
jgi:hypothetical protein